MSEKSLMPKKILFTPREVAAMGFFAEPTLRNQRVKGTGLPYVKIGRSVRYRRDDLIAFLKKGKVHSQN
jgi:hypothetical protein